MLCKDEGKGAEPDPIIEVRYDFEESFAQLSFPQPCLENSLCGSESDCRIGSRSGSVKGMSPSVSKTPFIRGFSASSTVWTVRDCGVAGAQGIDRMRSDVEA